MSKYELNKSLQDYALLGNLEGIKSCMLQGADIESNSNTAFQYAATKGHLEILKFLIKEGIDLNERELALSLSMAAKYNHLSVVKYLIEKGANIHWEEEKAVKLAALNGSLETVKYLTKVGSDIHHNEDQALTMSADKKGNVKVTKFLIKNGADFLNYNNYTLRSAIDYPDKEAMYYLVSEYEKIIEIIPNILNKEKKLVKWAELYHKQKKQYKNIEEKASNICSNFEDLDIKDHEAIIDYTKILKFKNKIEKDLNLSKKNSIMKKMKI